MKKISKIISIVLTAIMLMGLMTTAAFAAGTLPIQFGWSSNNAGYITITVPAFDGDEIEYLLDLYKDGNRVGEDFGVYFDESGEFESEIFANKISELGNGTYTYKIGLERDFDTDEIVNGTSFSSEYVVTSFSHSVAVEPATGTEEPIVISPNPVAPQPAVPEKEEQEEETPKAIIKGQVYYANKYPRASAFDPIIYGESKPLSGATIWLYKTQGANKTKQPVKTYTDAYGNFEIEYKQGTYELEIYYGDSVMSVIKADTSAGNVDLGYFMFEPYDYKLSGEALLMPDNANKIAITEDNFNEYFEDVTIIGEKEKNADSLNRVSNYDRGNLFGAKVGLAGHRDYHLGESTANYNELNNLWFISSLNMKSFIFPQSNAIYDEKSNTAYYLSDNNTSNGYVVSRIDDNGLMTIAKYETTSYGNPTIYKITEMTARFKKLPYITVTYNGEMINFDQKPVAENGRTLVPLRAIFEKLGATVAWDGNTQTVTATKGDVVITLTLNNTTATKNGQPVILDVPAKAINGRTLVPVRFIADCFGVTTGWDGEAQRVILTD